MALAVVALAGAPSPTPSDDVTATPTATSTPASVSPSGATGSMIIHASLRVEVGEFGATEIPQGTRVRVEDADEVCQEFELSMAAIDRLATERFAEIGTIELPSKDGELVCGQNRTTIAMAVVFPSGSYIPFVLGPWTQGEVRHTFTIVAPIRVTGGGDVMAERVTSLPSTGVGGNAQAGFAMMLALAGALAIAAGLVLGRSKI